MAPDGLASAPHPSANRGGTVGGAAAASSEPPGLQRPEASHPPAGRPEPRAAPPALPIAAAGGERPALRDGSPAPGRLPQMAVDRGRQRRADHRPGGAGTIHCAASQEDRGWRNPTVRLSLSPPLLFLPLLSCLGPVPAWYPESSPDGGEVRLRSRRP